MSHGTQSGTVPVPEGYRVGSWIVGAFLGTGAFSTVYTARRDGAAADGLPERAALKFLPTGTRTPRQLRHLRDLAEREVELLSRVREPRLVRMYEVLTVDDPERPELDGATVLVLEEAAGALDALLAKERTAAPADGPELLGQICEGLVQLHRAGWVHGDLKPGNVLLMADGTTRLADFNMAAELDGTHGYAPAFATLDYTPPELLWSEVGERGRRIRPTADVWAFGVLAHMVLTGGRTPLPGGTPAARRDAAVRYARGREELALSPELPEPWRQIITDCLARTHEERAAHHAASLLPRVAAAAGRPRLRVRHPRRQLLATALVTAGVLTLAGLGYTLGPLIQNPPPSAAPSQQPSGYDRCITGSVCFFSEPDGHGDMCAWVGDDSRWAEGDVQCRWGARKPSRSYFNNGLGTDAGEQFVHVVYYAKEAMQDRLDCITIGSKGNLAQPVAPRSHMWVREC